MDVQLKQNKKKTATIRDMLSGTANANAADRAVADALMHTRDDSDDEWQNALDEMPPALRRILSSKARK